MAYSTVSTMGVAASHYAVCSNISFYVSGFCDVISQANPADSFTCQATALDGQTCPCVCNASATQRRLLEAYTSVIIEFTHMFETIAPPTTAPPWMLNVTFAQTCPITGCNTSGSSSPIWILVVIVLLSVCAVVMAVGCGVYFALRDRSVNKVIHVQIPDPSNPTKKD